MRPHRAVPDGKLHIVEDGAAEGEGWLNAALAYLLGFWHLDPQGILAKKQKAPKGFLILHCNPPT